MIKSKRISVQSISIYKSDKTRLHPQTKVYSLRMDYLNKI